MSSRGDPWGRPYLKYDSGKIDEGEGKPRPFEYLPTLDLSRNDTVRPIFCYYKIATKTMVNGFPGPYMREGIEREKHDYSDDTHKCNICIKLCGAIIFGPAGE